MAFENIDEAFEDFNIGLNEMEIDISNLGDFDVEMADTTAIETRYSKPKLILTRDKYVKFDNAVDLAKQTCVRENERVNCIVSGNFVFGDYIGAFLTTYDVKCLTMTINTLSLGAENIDMLSTLMEYGYIDNLNLIVSHYFYQHNKTTLIPMIYEQLDNDSNNFQLAVAGTHMKVVTFETQGGKHIVMHGSANLRSSANIEQFTIEENKELYDFYEECNTAILDRYKTINKALRRNALRDALGIEATKRRGKGGVQL